MSDERKVPAKSEKSPPQQAPPYEPDLDAITYMEAGPSPRPTDSSPPYEPDFDAIAYMEGGRGPDRKRKRFPKK